jgi:hypothetical protein
LICTPCIAIAGCFAGLFYALTCGCCCHCCGAVDCSEKPMVKYD